MTESSNHPNLQLPIDHLQMIVSELNACVSGMENDETQIGSLNDIVQRVEQQVEFIQQHQVSLIEDLKTSANSEDPDSIIESDDRPTATPSSDMASNRLRAQPQPAVVVRETPLNITNENRRENRLRLLASVFENTQEGIAILNPQGEICEANPEFIGTVEKSHSKILGKSLASMINCEPYPFAEIVNLACSGRPWFGYAKLINKHDEEISCWLSLSPATNEQGKTTNLIAMFSDITQIEDTRQELQRQALHDHLTDLPNRRFFRKRIEELIESDHDGTLRFGLSFLDLDDFKIVNDTLGHDAGDQLLVEFCKRVKNKLGPDCFLARFGGDEFALLVPESNGQPNQICDNSKMIIETLESPFELAGVEVHIGVSVGTTLYPDHAKDVESLMRNADVAMYRAKDDGKNKVTVFSSELFDAVEKRQGMLSDLRKALEHDEIRVVYQPKLCLKTNRITCCEALARWTRPDGTQVPPVEFITLAEDFGLVSRLGDMIIQNVCKQARAWYDAGILSGPIAINLSPRQLKEPGFFERLIETIESTKVRPEWIEFEITENAVMDDMDRALALMQKIDGLGVSIALDDFGTGYSSLSHIREFPIRTLKLDTSFVKDLPTCSRAVAIAQTVLSLGHGLGLQVVAEGVETREQLDFLRAAGCDMAQGYLISAAMPGNAYSNWLQSLSN